MLSTNIILCQWRIPLYAWVDESCYGPHTDSQDGLVCNFKKKKAYYKAGWLDRTGGYCLVKESCTNLTISVVRASGVCVYFR